MKMTKETLFPYVFSIFFHIELILPISYDKSELMGFFMLFL